MSSGRRRADKAPKPSALPYLAWLVVGAVACVTAWFFLVGAAINFGRAARSGQTLAWAFTSVATLGAIGCLLLMFVLLARFGRAVGVTSEYKGRRSSGGRRSAR